MRNSPESIRGKAIQAFESGQRIGVIAEVLGVHRRTVERWLSRYREEGHCRPKPLGHRPASISEGQWQQIEKLLRKRNDLTLQTLKEQVGLSCHVSTLCAGLIKRGWRFKKNAARERTRP